MAASDGNGQAQRAGHPGPVSLLAANTLYVHRGQLCDRIGSLGELDAWLKQWLPPAQLEAVVRDRELTGADLAAFHRVRDALRDGFDAVASSRYPPPAAIAELNEAAADAPLWPALHRTQDGLRIVEETSAAWPATALAAIARNGMVLLSGPRARTVRACASEECVQFFLTTDPRRRWCSASCGNRARVARHYDRHRRGPAAR